MNSDGKSLDEYSVYTFDRDGYSTRELSFVSAKQAADWARWLTEERAARSGEISMIRITDGGDYTVFEWRFGQGVTFV